MHEAETFLAEAEGFCGVMLVERRGVVAEVARGLPQGPALGEELVPERHDGFEGLVVSVVCL